MRILWRSLGSACGAGVGAPGLSIASEERFETEQIIRSKLSSFWCIRYSRQAIRAHRGTTVKRIHKAVKVSLPVHVAELATWVGIEYVAVFE